MPDRGFVPSPAKKPGRLRRGARFVLAPSNYVPVAEISEGWQFIGGLMRVIRERRHRTRKIRLDGTGQFDILAMAFDAGLTTQEIERRLANRRMQTRRSTKLYLGFGGLLLAGWFYAANGGSVWFGGMSLIDVVVFLAVTACFFVAAFYNALINWQVRTRRLGSIADFMTTNDSWWPS